MAPRCTTLAFQPGEVCDIIVKDDKEAIQIIIWRCGGHISIGDCAPWQVL